MKKSKKKNEIDQNDISDRSDTGELFLVLGVGSGTQTLAFQTGVLPVLIRMR